MNYYEWWGELDAIEVKFPKRNFRDYWMVEGRQVLGWNELITAVHNKSSSPMFDFGLAENAWPIFSLRMRIFLEKITPGSIQFLPFRLKTSSGSIIENSYFVGQVLRRVDCLDRTRTKVRVNWDPINESGDFETRHPIVLNKQLIGNERLFRVIGNCGPIVVSDELVRAIEDSNFGAQRFDAVLCSE